MATCNDCFHYEACKKIFQIAFKDFTDYTFVKACELYKPTADVVEVVRCKDCKYCEHCYPVKAIGGEAVEGWFCKTRKRCMLPDDFCSYGERKEDE